MPKPFYMLILRPIQNLFFANITPINSLITAAVAIVLWIIWVAGVETAIPVNTKDTQECGNSVKPRYLMTVAGHIIKVTPNRAIHNIGLNSCISEDNSDSLNIFAKTAETIIPINIKFRIGFGKK